MIQHVLHYYCLYLLNHRIYDTAFGVTDTSASPDPEESQEGEKETEEVPLELEEWAGNGPM